MAAGLIGHGGVLCMEVAMTRARRPHTLLLAVVVECILSGWGEGEVGQWAGCRFTFFGC